MSNYSRGRNFEYRVEHHYQNKGWVVVRSAGSKGAADLIAARQGEIHIIQCKIDGYLSPAEREQLKAVADEFGGVAVVAYRDKGKLCLSDLLTGLQV